MSYTPTQWQTGDTITAEKLNNMESGIEAANDGAFTFVATKNGNDYIFDHTLEEVMEARYAEKTIVCFVRSGEKCFPTFVERTDNGVVVTPVLDSTDVAYEPRCFTIYEANGAVSYSVIFNEPLFVIPKQSGNEGNYSVPMVDPMENSLCFEPISFEINIGDAFESFFRGVHVAAGNSGGEYTGTATFSDSDALALIETIFNRVNRNMQDGRGVFIRVDGSIFKTISPVSSYMPGVSAPSFSFSFSYVDVNAQAADVNNFDVCISARIVNDEYTEAAITCTCTIKHSTILS